ncbi:MAG: hypothetical protein E7649_01435 [Ruminococcaceae bacterium]|nr:hypothetical protein [Oscillospiraceae bacterium]
MTDMENANGTLTELSSKAESIADGEAEGAYDAPADDHCEENEFERSDGDDASIDLDGIAASKEHDRAEREEYERLIRTRFKQFYTDDTQKMINKRFKRYKAMEQKLSTLEQREGELERREAELDSRLDLERARIEKEMERRVMASVLSNKLRPSENGYAKRRAALPIDVSSLTRDQRAQIAKRAFGGEKISF